MNAQRVFEFFERICEIPHGSGNTEKISSFCVEFAKQRNLRFFRDNYGNIVIYKSASAGYEHAETLIVQGHLDMVCRKSPSSSKDMEREGITLKRDGDMLFAEGTTLGADNGIAVAMMLALLDDDSIAHPPLEMLFTVDEEIGMLGALGLDMSVLTGKYLLNLDSEEEGVFIVSAAGGKTLVCGQKIEREPVSGGNYCSIWIGGGKGGHSGAEIHKNLMNANEEMTRLLYDMNKHTEIRLCVFSGGEKDNVITPEAKAEIWTTDWECCMALAKSFGESLRRKYEDVDPGVFIRFEEIQDQSLPLSKEDTDNILKFFFLIPKGVQSMDFAKGEPLTSSNFAVVESQEQSLYTRISLRSNFMDSLSELAEKISYLAHFCGISLKEEQVYPVWECQKDSKLQEIAAKAFYSRYNFQPKILSIHAGLECGVFSEKRKDICCLSLGPTLKNVHTEYEMVSVSSVERTWGMVLDLLALWKAK